MLCAFGYIVIYLYASFYLRIFWFPHELFVWFHAAGSNSNAGQVGHPILMTECECNPSFSRARMSELLFETYGVPSIGNDTYLFVPLLSIVHGSFEVRIVDAKDVSSYVSFSFWH